jgi:carboxymethylenebutenolidase
MSKTVSFKRPDGQSVSGYLAEPTQTAVATTATAPAIVVIQEWWGLNAQIRGVADRLAAAGYRALVPDLYRGKSTVDAEEAHHLMTGLNFADAASQDICGAMLFLKQQSARVGVTGFCMGGALTVLSLTMIPQLAAGVIWYGHPPLDNVDASKIKVPVLAHWALQDGAFPIAGVDVLETKFNAASVNYKGHRYLAQHGFANETAQGPGRVPITQYDAAWAQMAWDRSFSFFGRTLSRTDNAVI